MFTFLSDLIKDKHQEIDAWFDEHYKEAQPFFYNSVDIRHSGYKIAPVDTNLFPAGFNNLSDSAKEHASKQAKSYIDTYYPGCETVMFLPEPFTRNLRYLDNIYVMGKILEGTGRKVILGHSNPTIRESLDLVSAEGYDLHLEKLTQKKKNVITVDDGIVPDLIIVNNDLTTGIPEFLINAKQTTVPSLDRGWNTRKKSLHFASYEKVAHHFADHFKFDPWLISTTFHHCGTINFKERKGVECVALAVEKTIHQLTEKYKEHNIEDEPYVFIKAEKGTYGMGIMTAKSGDDVINMNREIRKKMSVIKGGTENTEVVIQEGIPTIDQVDDHPAEPLVCMIGGKPIGHFYRVNSSKDVYGNLNAKGMSFQIPCEEELPVHTKEAVPIEHSPYGLIARLASLAAVLEQ